MRCNDEMEVVVPFHIVKCQIQACNYKLATESFQKFSNHSVSCNNNGNLVASNYIRCLSLVAMDISNYEPSIHANIFEIIIN